MGNYKPTGISCGLNKWNLDFAKKLKILNPIYLGNLMV